MKGNNTQGPCKLTWVSNDQHFYVAAGDCVQCFSLFAENFAVDVEQVRPLHARACDTDAREQVTKSKIKSSHARTVDRDAVDARKFSICDANITNTPGELFPVHGRFKNLPRGLAPTRSAQSASLNSFIGSVPMVTCANGREACQHESQPITTC